MAEKVSTGVVAEPLLDRLLGDLVPGVPFSDERAAYEGAAARAVTEHRDHREAWYGDLVGPLRVPASATPAVLGALRPGDHGLPVVLTPDPVSDDLLGSLRTARSMLLDNHRVELVGVELPFAAADSAADAARLGLAALDFTVPAWFMVRAEPGWESAFDVLALDGAESVALYLPEPGSPEAGATAVEGIAGVLRALVDREIPFAVTDGVTGPVTGDAGYGLLNLLAAVRAALAGAPAAALVPVLTERDLDEMAAAARRTTEADAAATRAFLSTVRCPSIREMVQALEGEGLIEPDAA
jgi:hypothetical protein